MRIITIREILQQMEKGDIFSIKFVKYDRSRKKGGEIRHFPEAVLHTKSHDDEVTQAAMGRPLTVVEQKMKDLNALKAKQPNHHQNYTRNLVLVQNGHKTSEKRKFHPALVLEFNNLQVVP